MRDDTAVGGFLEDLPVLVFVLVGVFSLVSTGIYASSEAVDDRYIQGLDSVAMEILDAISSNARMGDALGYISTVSSLRDANLTSLADGAARECGFCASIVVVHPRREWLCSCIHGPEYGIDDTGYANRLLNAVDDDGATAILEVKVLVW